MWVGMGGGNRKFAYWQLVKLESTLSLLSPALTLTVETSLVGFVRHINHQPSLWFFFSLVGDFCFGGF
jgi:hypothetical protein